MSRYVNVDRKFNYEDLMDVTIGHGGGDFDYQKINDEVLRQFESGSVDDNGNPIAYINAIGADIDVRFVVNKDRPWENHFEAKAVKFGRVVKAKTLREIDFYCVTGTHMLI